MEAFVRFAFCALALLVAVAEATVALAQAPNAACASAVDANISPNAGPYMKDLNMREPMAGQMKRDDMMLGDVAKSAAQKEKCMSEVMKLEERMIDRRKQ